MRIIGDLNGAIEHVKARIGILEVMEAEISITRSSDDMYKALCCFHDEKTPSLTITPSKGLYHCFGCGKSGDIVSFVQMYYNKNMMESVQWLSERYNVDLSSYQREQTPEEREKSRLYRVNASVRDRLHEALMGKNNRGYYYLTAIRGLSDDVIKEFGLGYSGSISDSMAELWSDEATANALEIDKGVMWADAVVYPLHDMHGKVVGFKNRPYWDGRTTDDRGAKLPKFVGTSSKSPLHSDENLYGLHVARRHIGRGRGRLIGVEGQHDVLKLHDHDVRNVVGTDGTNLSSDKLDTLASIGVSEFVVLYDGDAAGRDAALKVATHAAGLASSVVIKIAQLPMGMDPDEAIDRIGKIAILAAVEKAVYASQYLIDHIGEEVGLDSVTQRIDFIKRSYPVIAKSSASEQQFLIVYVAEKAGISPNVVEDMVREEQARGVKSLLYNINGEKVVLSGIMHDDDFRLKCMTELGKFDFYLPRHQELFGLLRSLDSNNTPVSFDTIKAAMNNLGLTQMFQNGDLIDEIFSTAGAWWPMFDDILDKSIRRGMLKQADDLRIKAQDLKNKPVVVVEEHIEGVLKTVHPTVGAATSDGKDQATGFMKSLHERMANPGRIVGVQMGDRFRNLTSMLNGLQRKSLITLSANQSVGKTTLLSQWLDDITITQQLPWLHFTLEMPNEQMTRKIIGARAGVLAEKIGRGNLTAEEYAAVQKATLEFYNGKLLLNDTAVTLESIIAETRKAIRSHNIQGISIDYVQLMRKEKATTRQKYEEEGEISGALKNDVAKGMNIPVVILSQMGRTALSKDTPKAEDGAGAYKISQDSDVYMILYEKSQEDIERYGIENGNMNLFVDKNRDGMADKILDLLFLRDTQTLMEVHK